MCNILNNAETSNELTNEMIASNSYQHVIKKSENSSVNNETTLIKLADANKLAKDQNKHTMINSSIQTGIN